MATTFSRSLNQVVFGSSQLNASIDDTTLVKDIDNGPTTLYGVDLTNAGASVNYVYFHNDPTPTLGSSLPRMWFPIEASTSGSFIVPDGLYFDTALTTCALSDKGTAANTSPVTGVTVRLTTIPD